LEATNVVTERKGVAVPPGETILSLKNITKIYPGVVALSNVSLDIRSGEIHAIVGENGAGKSTLIKVITGAITPEEGTIEVGGVTYTKMLPANARGHGIEAIYQEYNLVDGLSAAENICLGKKYGKLVNFKAMNKVAKEIFDRFGIDIDPNTLVRDLTSARRQIVEIAKAVSKDARILIMDEPTAPLTVSEVDILFEIVRTLKKEGVTIIYISHRLDEIFQLCDRVSVFRDGRYVTTKDVKDTNRPELIKLMVGREMTETYPQRLSTPGEVLFEIKNLTGNGVKNISFNARRGEIVGIGGLVGAGRSEIIRVAYGVEKRQWGDIYISGKKVKIKSPIDAQKYKIALIPEDRKREGAFLNQSIKWNCVISCLKKISRYLIVSNKKENEVAENYRKRLRIRTPSLKQNVINLSGGNQQKVVISKALAADSEIIIMDEPCRGIDVGAKHEIYELMNELCAEGKCIIMISSEMEELLGMSDRIVVLHEHGLAGEIPKEKFNQEYVLHLASGGAPEDFSA
jgi:ribose transport system ATP-binding protein